MSGQVPSEVVDFGLPDYDAGDPYKSGADPTESRDQGGDDPTGDVGAATTREEPFVYGVDSVGRKYPSYQYGSRSMQGGRRPPGIPPDIWKSLSKKDTMDLSAAAEPTGEAPAALSPSMIAKQPCARLGCERFCDQWVEEFESFAPLLPSVGLTPRSTGLSAMHLSSQEHVLVALWTVKK